MKELSIDAKVENLGKVLEFTDRELETLDCSVKVQTQIDIAVEEIFVNIASYAYVDGVGKADITIEHEEGSQFVSITFTDQGIPYDPLKKEDPDVTLSAEEREIGGLGIYMVKKSMDDVIYRYENGSNILTLVKNLSA
ncbi:MAG: ATP-binding protein [Lachnospiraceae bacterium]|nr:ATP-binding protein [Lachnospiraceae bacterium]